MFRFRLAKRLLNSYPPSQEAIDEFWRLNPNLSARDTLKRLEAGVGGPEQGAGRKALDQLAGCRRRRKAGDEWPRS
jgi:hypothetical protein